MLKRRRFIQTIGTLIAGGNLTYRASAKNLDEWYMPDEGAKHKRTWMAFGASEQIWGRKAPAVRRNLSLIANTIVQYEPVSMLVRKNELSLAKKQLSPNINLIESSMDDLWMRDTGPLFVVSKRGGKIGLDFNFNGWGEKQEHAKDSHIADTVTQKSGVEKGKTDLVLEGGAIEVDGAGTAIITESCVLNTNRNPGLSKADVEKKLKPLLGLQKIIWLPGIKNKDITDGHTDFYARFVMPGVVLAGFEPNAEWYDHDITKRHVRILQRATDARSKPLRVIVLEAPSTIRKTHDSPDFAAGYMGFYVCNGAVIMQEFGDTTADRNAKNILKEVFPNRSVVSIDIDAIAGGGGSIHCTTQQEPEAPSKPIG